MYYVLSYRQDGNHLAFAEFSTLGKLRLCVDYIDKYHRNTDIYCCKVLKDLNIYRFKFYRKSKPFPYLENVGLHLNNELSEKYEEFKNAHK